MFEPLSPRNKNFLAALMLLAAMPASAAGSLNVMGENDSFHNEIDRHYTSGLYLSFTGDELAAAQARWGDAVAETLMLPPAGPAKFREGWFLGQAIFTPENLTAAVPPIQDRPYAGWLYGGVRLYRESDDVLDRADLTLGMVGPVALGAEVQNGWHGLGVLGGLHANGWHYQLRNEPGVVLSEQRSWRVTLLEGPLEIEAMPEANIALGNIYDYVGAGAMLRIGQGLKSDWGPPRMAPAEQGADFTRGSGFAWYLFAGGESRALARNLFLDGNSFQASRSVRRETLVSDFNAGLALLFRGLAFDLSYTQRSHEFAGQRGNDAILSGTVSFPY